MVWAAQAAGVPDATANKLDVSLERLDCVTTAKSSRCSPAAECASHRRALAPVAQSLVNGRHCSRQSMRLPGPFMPAVVDVAAHFFPSCPASIRAIGGSLHTVCDRPGLQPATSQPDNPVPTECRQPRARLHGSGVLTVPQVRSECVMLATRQRRAGEQAPKGRALTEAPHAPPCRREQDVMKLSKCWSGEPVARGRRERGAPPPRQRRRRIFACAAAADSPPAVVPAVQ